MRGIRAPIISAMAVLGLFTAIPAAAAPHATAGVLTMSSLACQIPPGSGPAVGNCDTTVPANVARVCAVPSTPRGVTCNALVRTDVPKVTSLAPATAPAGYGPADLQAAYGLTDRSSRVHGGTVAIVAPFDNPIAESDLAAYRSQFGLPDCRTAGGCFTKVNQNGATGPLPRADGHWAMEIDLSLEMVSAICPLCQILLVEASSGLPSDLFTAEDYATAHAKFVSNSWSYAEANETANDVHFNRPGVVITVATGDFGNGEAPQYPATSPYVVAVGGTSLSRSGNGFAETAWSRAASACSLAEPKPAWQPPVAGCATRATADVSAVADPNSTGIAIFDAGWIVMGGTSAAAPIIAATFALAGVPRATDNPAAYLYANAGYLHDITSGSNGNCGGPLCNAGAGWDGPTGVGTPIGADGFAWYPPVRANIPDQTTTLNTPVSLNLNTYVSGGVPPYHYWPGLIDSLPPGLSVDRDTGIVTGTPTTPGTYPVLMEVGDTSSTFGFVDVVFIWTIAMPQVQVPDIVGDSRLAATRALGGVNLSLGTETDKATTNCDLVGTIGSQNPIAGTHVSEGSSVSFTMWVLMPGGHCQ